MRKGRRSIRLQGYDYSKPGAYFLTLCTHDKVCLFGDIVNGEMQLNHIGQIVSEEWQKSEVIRKEIKLDAFVVMPNHLHGIVVIEYVGAQFVGAQTKTQISGIICGRV